MMCKIRNYLAGLLKALAEAWAVMVAHLDGDTGMLDTDGRPICEGDCVRSAQWPDVVGYVEWDAEEKHWVVVVRSDTSEHYTEILTDRHYYLQSSYSR